MSQRGFSLVELTVSMAIGVVVMSVVVPAIYTMRPSTARINGSSVALADIDRAAHWLIMDISQARTTNLVDSAPAVSQITLNWDDLTTWAAQEGIVSHTASYNLTGSQLQRTLDGQTITVGRYLTDVDFSVVGRMISITLTSSNSSFVPQTTVTRTYKVYLRSEPAL